jgi:hypothetical protein
LPLLDRVCARRLAAQQGFDRGLELDPLETERHVPVDALEQLANVSEPRFYLGSPFDCAPDLVAAAFVCRRQR